MQKYSFNDGWTYKGKEITLPHDAMITAERSAKAASGGGCAYFEGGVYEYEKTFHAPVEWETMEICLQFEGVYRNARVYLNDKEIGGADYGYIPFFVRLENLNYGGNNKIRVVADNSMQPNSRWYSGGGIYRPVWLWICVKGGFFPECLRITTVSCEEACIRAEISMGIDICKDVQVEILDKEKVVASSVISRDNGRSVEMRIPQAKLWSTENPYLYTCRVTSGEDMAEERFGIRKVEWSNKGLYINGKETLLRGGCIHHDNGILGAACYEESEWRKVRMLKEAGYNALRISHNPASAAMLEACDYYGLYVIDEAWDMWYNRKNKCDYGMDFLKNYQSDLTAMVNRDYNHPCVIMYSIGNEVSEPATSRGVELAKEMTELLHRLDKSRAVTAGINLMILSRAAKGNAVYSEDGNGRDESEEQKMAGMNSLVFNMITNMVGSSMNKGANSKKADVITTPVLDALDIAGYNYASGRYPLEGKAHPDRVIFGSETFPQDLPQNWEMVKKYPYLTGDFMWTAWDYIGEAGGGAWAYTSDGKGFQKPYPWLLADMGAMDILGNPNGELFWAQSVWGLLKTPRMAVQPVNHPGIRPAKSSWRGTNAIPSWSWQGCEGNKAVVEVYYDCARVELLLDGHRVAKAKTKKFRAVLKTKYAPGRLEAVCYSAAGKEIGRCVLQTSKKAEIQIKPEVMEAIPGQIVYIPVELGDGQEVEANSDRKLTVTVRGGELLAFGSANPRTEERFHSGSYTTYYGRALAVVRALTSGKMCITVTDGKCEASEEILVNEPIMIQ